MAQLLDKYMNDTLKNSPLAYYRMREGTGTVLTDWSPNPLNGTYNGSGVTWATVLSNANITGSIVGFSASSGTQVPLFNSWTFPNSASASSISTFDGVAGRATSTLTGINTSAASVVTVEMWAKWDGNLAGANGTFEALANFGGATGLLLGFLKNGAADYRFGLSVRNSGDLWGINNAQTIGTLRKDMWHHIVFVIVNNNVQTSKLYINGVQYTMTQQIGTSTTTDSVTTTFALGYDGTASFFQGSLAEVVIYNSEPYDSTSVNTRYHTGAYGGEPNEDATLPGVESQIELDWNPSATTNTLYLNVKPNGQRVMNQYYVDDIGGMDDVEYRFAEESNFYRDGMNPLITKAGGRTLTLTGYMEGTNVQKMRQMQNDLRGAVSYNTGTGYPEFPMIFRNVWDNAYDFAISARRNQPLQMKETQTTYRARRDFMLTMRASFPYFESVGMRTEIVYLGASLANGLPNRGNATALPFVKVWGPFNQAFLSVGTFMTLTSVAISTFVTTDAKTRQVSSWPAWSPTNDFPFISANGINTSVAFISALGATTSLTRMEVTWRHTMI